MFSRALVAFTWGLVTHQISQHAEPNPDADKLSLVNQTAATVDRLVETYKDAVGAPGAAVCISIGGTTVYSKGFGFADVEQGVKVTPNTKFRIASISKSFTSLLVGRMIDRGRINLDEDIKSYLPYFSPKTKDGKTVPITVRQLMSHTSGVRHYRISEEEENSDKYPEEIVGTKFYETAQDSLAIFKDDPLVHSPGEDYLYSTYGYTVISAIIEAIMAKLQPVESLFELPIRLKPPSKETKTKPSDEAKISSIFRQLFTFLGLRNTCLDEPYKIVPFRARPYRREKNNYGRLVNAAWVDNSSKWAGGGLLSTGPDLIRMANHLGDIYMGRQPLGTSPIVSRETLVNCLWHPNTGTVQGPWISGGLYGLGWFVARRSAIPADLEFRQVPADRLYVGHTGAAVGFTSILLMSLPILTKPEPSQLPPICVAVLVNLESASGIGSLAVQIVEAITDSLIFSHRLHTYSKEPLAIAA